MIYTPIVLTSGKLPSGGVTLFTPPAGGVILTQVILANRGAVESKVLITWNNGSEEVALIGNTPIQPETTLMVELYVPLMMPANTLRGLSSTGNLDFTIAGMGLS